MNEDTAIVRISNVGVWDMTKIRSDKGFTLAELLVVVAIIGVLVAVGIPIFFRQLEKAREATDLGNLRAAKAAALNEYMSGTFEFSDGSKSYVYLYYDAAGGVLVYAGSGNNSGSMPGTLAGTMDSASEHKVSGYGRQTKTDGGTLFTGYTHDYSSEFYHWETLSGKEDWSGKIIKLCLRGEGTENGQPPLISYDWVDATK